MTTSTGRIDREVAPIELPVGLDTERFYPRDVTSENGQTLVGYSGRMSLEKNVDEILRVARRLSEYDFLVVGEGPQRPRLEPRAPDNVTFRDFLPREQLPRFYSSLDAFVTASTADTLGLSTLEANACGTPVAATNVPPFTRTIGPENGVRFEFGDGEDMAAAIDRCLSESWSTRPAVKQYSVDRTITRLERIYARTRATREVTVEQTAYR